jgi:hypothetical protein
MKMLVYISPGPCLASTIVRTEKKEVKIPKVTQAIEMEINAVNHDKNEHFYYHRIALISFP